MDETTLITLLEEARARRARGEAVDLGAYRERLGDLWGDFCEILWLDDTFQQAMDPAIEEGLPREFGEYTLLRELGHGAVGVVYEAYHARLDRRVALKTLRPEFEDDAQFRERYERETRSCAQVRHPSLVEIYEAGEVDGRLFYAMPLLDGTSLAELVKQAGVPAVPDLCRQIAGVAEALAALHAARIVHRDIKPSNIMVEASGRFVLADFGLARRVDLPALTRTGDLVGTPIYMSPEQLKGDTGAIDERTDVYALGATLYEAVSGKRPFPAEDLEALHYQVLSQRPAALRGHARDCPAELEAVILKCLEKRPEDRYASASDLAGDLRALAGGAPVLGRPVPAWRQWVRRVGRPQLAVAALLLAALGVWALLGSADDDPAANAPFHLPPGATLDLDAIRRYAEEHDLPIVIIVAEQPQRGQGDAPLQLVWPRGAMRKQDLTSVRVDVSARFRQEGRLVFEKDGEELASQEFKADDYENRLPIPAAVLAAAMPGAKMTWSFVPDRGDRVTASFAIVVPDLDVPLAKIAHLTSGDDVAAGLERLLRAHVLLDAGLHAAAFRELEPLRAAEPEADSEPAVRLQLEALRRAYGDDLAARDAASAWRSRLLRLEDMGAEVAGDR